VRALTITIVPFASASGGSRSTKRFRPFAPPPSARGLSPSNARVRMPLDVLQLHRADPRSTEAFWGSDGDLIGRSRLAGGVEPAMQRLGFPIH